MKVEPSGYVPSRKHTLDNFRKRMKAYASGKSTVRLVSGRVQDVSVPVPTNLQTETQAGSECGCAEVVPPEKG